MVRTPVEPGPGSRGRCSLSWDKQKTACAAPCLLPRWRPTDLCATVLFSFQGTNADAGPISDRITDRTGWASVQSHDGYLSTVTPASQGKNGPLAEIRSERDPGAFETAVDPVPTGETLRLRSLDGAKWRLSVIPPQLRPGRETKEARTLGSVASGSAPTACVEALGNGLGLGEEHQVVVAPGL